MTPDAAERKHLPLYRGLLRYFPDALCEVALCSLVGNAQHNAGVRHIVEAGKRDGDGVRHMAKAAWRCLAELQLEIERDSGPAVHRAKGAKS
jgi:hypothetical protein